MAQSRYHRQMLLPWIGEAGQARLAQATVAVVGCGALGCVSASWLVRAGVGHVKLIDRDVVERTNLQRQLLFDEDDASYARPKAEAAKAKLAAANRDVRVTAIIDDLDHRNIDEHAGDADVLLDATDNFETRFLLNDFAAFAGRAYLYAGVVATVGMMYPVLPHTQRGGTPWEQAGVAGPCLRCLFQDAPPPGPDSGPTCQTAGVLGPAVGVIASLQASEAIKILTHNWASVSRCMVHVDLASLTFRQLDVTTSDECGACPCCGQHRFDYLDGKHASRTTKLCGRNAVQLARAADAGSIALEALAERLSAYGPVRCNELMLWARVQDGDRSYELTVFENGRAIVKGTEDPATARSVYARFVGG